jgi:chromate reductase
MKPSLVVLAGSLRTESYNKKLATLAANTARTAGADVTHVDLREFPMPIYDGDIEARDGIPETAKKLKGLFISHHGFLIASPEYNSSVSGVLKNTIDWLSRPAPGEGSLVAFNEKIAGIMSASPGALGGLRGLVHLRAILGNIGVWVVPDQVSIMSAQDAFNADGTLKDPKKSAGVEKVVKKVIDAIAKLRLV